MEGKENTAQEVQPDSTPSIRDRLSEAFDELEKEDEEEVVDEQPEEEPEPEPEEEPPEPSDEAEEPEEEEQPEPEEEPQAASPIPAPEHWAPEHRELFEKLDPEYQQFLLERHREMEAAYTRARQEESQKLRQYEPLEQTLARFRPVYQSRGMQDADFIGLLGQYYAALAQNPQETIKNLAKQFNVQWDGSTTQDVSDEDEYLDPAVAKQLKEIREGLNTLKSGWQQQQSAQVIEQQQRQQQEYMGQWTNYVQEWGKQVGPDKKPMYPHFSEVAPQMRQLIQGGIVAGDDPDTVLKDAYNKALALTGKATRTTQPASDGEAVRKAKRAAKGVQSRSASSPKSLKKGASIRETLLHVIGDNELTL